MALFDGWQRRGGGSTISLPPRPDLWPESSEGSQPAMAQGVLLPPTVEPAWMQVSDWRSWVSPDALVVGESHHFDGIAPHVGPPRQLGFCIPVNVTFRREADNPFDGNAIMALVEGRQVGYIGRHRAAQIAKIIDAVGLAEFQLAGVIIGGFLDRDARRLERHSFGVFVWLDKRISAGPPIEPTSATAAWPPQDGLAFKH